MISEHAIIHPGSTIHPTASVGPFSVIGEHVEIGPACEVGSHVVINGPTRLGARNRIFQFASIGEDCQDKKYSGEGRSELIIGDDNDFREFITIHRGTEEFGGVTRIGNHNLFMAYTHVAHDCDVGNHCVFSNNATLGGHVHIDDYVNMAGFSAVHQFCKVGSHSFIAKASMVTKDVLPFLMVDGNPPTTHGLNLVGLKRRDFSQELIDALKQAYKIIFRRSLTTTRALAELEPLKLHYPEVAMLCSAIETSTRGIVR